MGQYFTKTDHKFLVECQSQLSQLDGMLLGIVSSLDSMHIAFTQLLRQLEELNPDKTDGFKQNHFDSIELTKKLLSSVENGLCHQKTALLQEISQFARIIKWRSDPGKSISKCIPALDDLKIDRYLSTVKVPEVSDKSKKVENVECHEQPSKDIGRNIASLKEQNRLYLTQIKSLEEKSQKLMKKNDELRNKITKLENEGIQLVTVEDDENIDKSKETLLDDNPNQIAEENQRLKAMNESLENKLETIMSKKFIHVQLFNAGPKTMPVEELTEILKKRINTDRCHLYMDEKRNKSELTSDMPILVLSYLSRGPSNAAAAAMEDVKVTSAVVLVFVYRNVQPSSIRSSEGVILNTEYKKLGGIFDLVNSYQKSIYSCSLNDTNISGIVDFINTNGVKIPQAKTYGLCD